MAAIPLALTDEQRALKAGVAEICKRYPGEYWRELDAKREYPEAFVNELTRTGYLACLIPHEYGGAGLGLREGGLILETIHANGGSASACHAQMYIMGTVLRHGSDAQKQQYLPKIASGELRLHHAGRAGEAPHRRSQRLPDRHPQSQGSRDPAAAHDDEPLDQR